LAVATGGRRALSGYSGHRRDYCWLDPVVNDPKRRFAAMQRYVRSGNTSRHGADIVSVPPQPPHASLIGGEPRSSSGSLAMLAALMRAAV